jgi:hypothetical protein
VVLGYRRFGGTCSLYLQRKRITEAADSSETLGGGCACVNASEFLRCEFFCSVLYCESASLSLRKESTLKLFNNEVVEKMLYFIHSNQNTKRRKDFNNFKP